MISYISINIIEVIYQDNEWVIMNGSVLTMATEKEWLRNSFLISQRKRGYSLEVPHRGTSNKYPQHVLLRNKKTVNAFLSKKVPYLDLC